MSTAYNLISDPSTTGFLAFPNGQICLKKGLYITVKYMYFILLVTTPVNALCNMQEYCGFQSKNSFHQFHVIKKTCMPDINFSDELSIPDQATSFYHSMQLLLKQFDHFLKLCLYTSAIHNIDLAWFSLHP